MAAHRDLPSRDDTVKVVKQLEELTNEMKRLSEQLSELARNESAPRLHQRKRRSVQRASH